MKTIKQFILPFILLLIFVAAFSCKKNQPDYPFTINVKTLEDTVSVANIHVEILARDGGGFKTFFDGYTDENGQVNFDYDQEAIFTIRATRGNPYTYIGCADIRLMPDQRVTKDVYIAPYDSEAQGCFYTP